MEWETWKKKKRKVRREWKGARTISFMSATHLNFIQRYRSPPFSLCSRTCRLVDQKLFPPFVVLKQPRLSNKSIDLHETKSIAQIFLAKKLKKTSFEKVRKRKRVKSVMLDFSLESWLGIRAKISGQKWLNIVQRAPCLVTKQPVADNATIF